MASDKFFPKYKGFVILRDNPYLPIAVKRIQKKQPEIFSFWNFIISENIGKGNLLVLANLPKPIFANLP